jgi:hypothetical protein
MTASHAVLGGIAHRKCDVRSIRGTRTLGPSLPWLGHKSRDA